MQAVILAAGLSKRLRPLTDEIPKCLLNLGKSNLLHMTIENVLMNGIDEFVIVTGFKENLIKNYVNDVIMKLFPDTKIQLLSNQDYAKNNNSFSLWLTKKFISSDILLLDSDILFDYRIIKLLLESEHKDCISVNYTDKLDKEQIKVETDKKKRILKIGKDVDISKAVGESIGIEKFDYRTMKIMFEILERKIVKEKNVNEFYEVTFQEMIDADKTAGFFSVDISDYNCIEIDTIEDYENAGLMLNSTLSGITRSQTGNVNLLDNKL